MRILIASTGEQIQVDDEDFDRLSHINWSVGGKAGLVPRRFLHYRINSRWKTVGTPITHDILGVEDKVLVDHIDGNKLNNQKSNLRTATFQQNCHNSFRHSDSEIPYKGVSRKRKDYRARIFVGGRDIYLGQFPTLELAAKAYDEAAKIHYGIYAKLNFV